MNNINMILQQKYANVKNFNEDYLNWYIMYVFEHVLPSKLENQLSENHHVLPEGDFPEFANFKRNRFNKAILPSKSHYIAHWLLYKAAPTKVNVFAFNQMKRVLDKSDREDITLGSLLYEEARQTINENLASINIGRKHTKEFREHCSKLSKNMVVVYDINDVDKTSFQVNINDPKYISGEYVFYRTGTIHNIDTINKMKDNSGLLDKIAYAEVTTKKLKYFSKSDVVPNNYVKGWGANAKELCSVRMTGLDYYHDPISKDQGRFYSGLEPTGWVRGKTNFGEKGNPFSSNKMYKNLLTNQTGMIGLSDGYPKYCCNPSVPESSRFAYILDNKVCFNHSHLNKINEQIPISLGKLISDKARQNKMSQPINLNRVRSEFRSFLQSFKTYNDIGIIIMPVSKFFNLKNFETFIWIG